jgi:glycosyltransferase involved in cell wall biosynthesis
MASADAGLQILANVPAFYYGTSPNKFFDYLSAGLPVLTNYPGWVAELVTKHDCGVAVPPENAEMFADALIAMKEKTDHNVHRSNARGLARNNFSRDGLGKSFVAQLTGQS